MENNNTDRGNDNLVMDDFDVQLIADFFAGLDRQGPGGDKQTLQALRLIRDYLPQNPVVADLGCGTGRQTSVLAQAMECKITAVDLLPQMVEGLKRRIDSDNLKGCVTPLQASMGELPFDKKSLDLIWAEGSIYNIGFEKGLTYWRDYLRSGGIVAVTECSWLSRMRPSSMEWFTDNFVEIDTIVNKLKIMEQLGYVPLGHFVLPEECWTENYYAHIEQRFDEFMAQNADNKSAAMLVRQLSDEIAHYRSEGQYYGYVFYIGRLL